MTRYDDDTVEYLSEAEILRERAGNLMTATTEKIISDVETLLESDDSKYTLSDYDLVSNIMDYYMIHRRLSEKQKYCLCKAIAEDANFY